MPTVNGTLKTRELKLQGSSNAPDFKLKVHDDELHVKRGDTSLMTFSLDEDALLSGDINTGADKITITAPVDFTSDVKVEGSFHVGGEEVAMKSDLPDEVRAFAPAMGSGRVVSSFQNNKAVSATQVLSSVFALCKLYVEQVSVIAAGNATGMVEVLFCSPGVEVVDSFIDQKFMEINSLTDKIVCDACIGAVKHYFLTELDPVNGWYQSKFSKDIDTTPLAIKYSNSNGAAREKFLQIDKYAQVLSMLRPALTDQEVSLICDDVMFNITSYMNMNSVEGLTFSGRDYWNYFGRVSNEFSHHFDGPGASFKNMENVGSYHNVSATYPKVDGVGLADDTDRYVEMVKQLKELNRLDVMQMSRFVDLHEKNLLSKKVCNHIFCWGAETSKVVAKKSFDFLSGKSTYKNSLGKPNDFSNYSVLLNGLSEYNTEEDTYTSYDNMDSDDAERFLTRNSGGNYIIRNNIEDNIIAKGGKYVKIGQALIAEEKDLYDNHLRPLLKRIAKSYQSGVIKETAIDDDYPGVFRWFLSRVINHHPHLPHDESGNLIDTEGTVMYADDSNMNTDTGEGVKFTYTLGGSDVVPAAKMTSPVSPDDPLYYEKLPLYKKGDNLYGKTLAHVTGYQFDGPIPAFAKTDTSVIPDAPGVTAEMISGAFDSSVDESTETNLPEKMSNTGVNLVQYFNDIGSYHLKAVFDKIKDPTQGRSLLDVVEEVRNAAWGRTDYKTNMRIALENETYNGVFVGGPRTVNQETFTTCSSEYINQLWNSQVGGLVIGNGTYDPYGPQDTCDLPLRSDWDVNGTNSVEEWDDQNPVHRNTWHPDHFDYKLKEHYKTKEDGSPELDETGNRILLTFDEFKPHDFSDIRFDRVATLKYRTQKDDFEKGIRSEEPEYTPQLTWLYQNIERAASEFVNKTIVSANKVVLPNQLQKYIDDKDNYRWFFQVSMYNWASWNYYDYADPQDFIMFSYIPTSNPEECGNVRLASGIQIHENIIGHGLQSLLDFGLRKDEVAGSYTPSSFRNFTNSNDVIGAIFPSGGQSEGWAVYGELVAWEEKLECYRLPIYNTLGEITGFEEGFDDLVTFSGLASTSRVAARLECDTNLHFSKFAKKFGRIQDLFFERTGLPYQGWAEVTQRFYGGPTQSTHYALGYLVDVNVRKAITRSYKNGDFGDLTTDAVMAKHRKDVFMKDYIYLLLTKGALLAPNRALFEFYLAWFDENKASYAAISDETVITLVPPNISEQGYATGSSEKLRLHCSCC